MTDEWMRKYEDMKDKLASWIDLDTYFTEKKIGDTDVDALDIGTVSFPTGRILACDPLIELEDRPPYIQSVPPGTYLVTICVMPSEKYGDRYACVKVTVSDAKPVRYDLAMIGDEDLDEELEDGDYFGFCVDAGMGCIADVETQKAFREYWAKRLEEDEDIDPYNDLFCDLLEESYQRPVLRPARRELQREPPLSEGWRGLGELDRPRNRPEHPDIRVWMGRRSLPLLLRLRL